MTNNIYPPDHLLRKWEELIIDEEQNVDVVLYEAFQAGADHELEACCEWLCRSGHQFAETYVAYLRAARRPKPPSLKAGAIEVLDELDGLFELPSGHYNTILRALEQLDDSL
jgi:hypothetical protein